MTWFEQPKRCYFIILTLSLIYFAPLWRHPTQLIYSKHSDILWQHFPWRVFAVSSWHETGELPLWCPYGCSGQPFQADGQSTLFYPPHAIFYVVPQSWVTPMFGLLVWEHVFLAGCSMFAYARNRGLVPLAALAAAIGFMFAGKWLVHVLEAGHYIYLLIAWFPLLLLCVERAVQLRRLGWAAAAGGCLAMLLTGGHPQLNLYCLLVAGLLSLRAVADRGSSVADGQLSVPGLFSSAGRWLFTWCIAASLAAGLAAVQLLPTLEFVTFTTRANIATAGFDQKHDLTFRSIAELGRRLLSLVGPRHFSGNPWEAAGNLGVLWAAGALLTLGLCRRPVVWLYGAVLLLMALVAFGTSTPVYGWLCHIVPGLSLFHNQARILVLAGFPLGMLVGHLTQAVFDPKTGLNRWSLAGAAGVAGVLVVLYLVPSLKPHAPGREYAICLVITGAAFVAVLLARMMYPAGVRRLAGIWLVLLLADLWALHARFVDTKPVASIYPTNDAVRFFAEHSGSYRILDRPPAGRPRTYSPLTQALCYRHGLRWVRAQNPSDLYVYKKYLNYVADSDAKPELGEVHVVGDVVNQQLLDLLNVRYLIVLAGQRLSPHEQENWEPVAMLGDTRVHLEEDSTPGGIHRLPTFVVYQRKAALPRAFVVSRAEPAPPEKEMLPTLRTTDLYRTVLLDGPSGWCDSTRAVECDDYGGHAFQDAQVTAESPNRMVVEVTCQQPGYLVLSEIWYPGWKCYLADGSELPVWRANGLFRAVKLPAGRHQLSFVFAPTIYRIGGAISLLTLVGLAGWIAWGAARKLRRQRRARAQTQRNEILATKVVLADRLMPDVLSRREQPLDSPVTASRKESGNGRS